MQSYYRGQAKEGQYVKRMVFGCTLKVLSLERFFNPSRWAKFSNGKEFGKAHGIYPDCGIVVNPPGQTTQFVYDDGNMVKKIKPDVRKTIYVGGIYEVDKNSGGTVTRTVTYYPVGGAMRINITGGSNTVYYILKDHLGSASVITYGNATGIGDHGST